ncbi:helix-turn-helix domain-containing protein [Nitrospirillum amazonense]|uniref:XRE family transcriptional regulator n=1 Tax=Nitrospirillum amazonense TaxID=28077 RepID=A0A560JEV6_9PROT|nr:XRE family transcriptional regulator [Nitrospirillum amazonense]MDG3442699.1 XRE family transcriptional regulator [Nitrospirillum amazonense]TWB67864.1 XRE family transcriptional regulator [Nitrospirillum amazonense]
MAKSAPDRAHPALALRAARIKQGLTLRALAARIGMPFSTLSKLENGKMEMTYDKLLRLAQGLGVDIGTLVSSPGPEAEPPPAGGRRSVSRAGRSPGATSDVHAHQYPAADLLGKLMVPIIIEVRARSVAEMGGMVRHSGEEYLYVLSGAMELHTDLYAPLRLEAGDSVYFDSGMSHVYVRVSEETCRVLSVCAGPGIQRLAQSAAKAWKLSPATDEETV